MMKCLIVGVLLAVSIIATMAVETRLNRAKRFAGFGAIQTVGGRVGCVAVQDANKDYLLFVNGRKAKVLSEEEVKELNNYRDSVARYREELKKTLEKEAQLRQSQVRQGVSARGGNNSNKVNDTNVLKTPDAPKRPSFCLEKDVTQYVFDGCSVQGEKLYVVDTYVRDLTPDEQEELKNFDEKITAYHKAISNNFRQQLEGLFGKNFNFFSNGNKGLDSSQQNSQSSEVSGAHNELPEQPKAPNFCTLVV